MKKGAGKAKGSAFERWVAQELSKWLTGGKDHKQLIRAVLSGGWSAGQKSAEGWRQVGDLAPNGPEGERFRKVVAVECKHHREIDLYSIWTKQTGLQEWWAKLQADARKAGVGQMLVFRANSRPTMLMLNTSLWHDINKRVQKHTSLVCDAWFVDRLVDVMRYPAWDAVLMPLDAFLLHVKPAEFFGEEVKTKPVSGA